MKPFNSKRGFTLLELTVVILIIGLLTTIVLANYRGGEKQSALLRSTHRLAQDLRQAEEMAMSSQKTPSGCEQVEAGVFPKGGYGIHFEKDSDSYILFADCDGEGNYDNLVTAHSCLEAEPGPGNSLKEIIKTLKPEEGIKICNLSPISPLDITFTPPDPIVNISGGAAEAKITLCLKDNESIFRIITVNKAGLIDTD
jgi:prepilin-type N-terminal cleavage/methylation domain-containing protein